MYDKGYHVFVWDLKELIIDNGGGFHNVPTYYCFTVIGLYLSIVWDKSQEQTVN